MRARLWCRLIVPGAGAVPDYSYETRCYAAHGGAIAGVDEAGRGPLAGPVVAAAVVLDADRIPDGLDDSKKLAAQTRDEMFARIVDCAAIGVGEASVDEIDLLNIRRATHLAMARAVRALKKKPRFALVDGNDAPALPCPCDTIIGGDGCCVSIAAASIVAKVTRDRMMKRLHEEHPGYGWITNMGYGTPEHLDALKRLGVTAHHRKSFAPVYQILGDYPFTTSRRSAAIR